MIAAARKLKRERLLICGGVAANSRLRALGRQRAEERELSLYVPMPKHCTDNGAMIAAAGFEAYQRGVRSELDLNADAAWRL